MKATICGAGAEAGTGVVVVLAWLAGWHGMEWRGQREGQVRISHLRDGGARMVID